MSHPDNEGPDVFDATPFAIEWTTAGHATEDSMYAWLDGALERHDHDALAQHVEACPTCQAAVAEARGYIAASARILHAGDVSSREPLSADDVTRASARVAAAVERNAPKVTPPWYVRRIMQIAAGACFMLAGAAYLTTRDGGRARMVASVGTDANVAPVAAPTPDSSPTVVASAAAPPAVQPSGTAPDAIRATPRATPSATSSATSSATPRVTSSATPLATPPVVAEAARTVAVLPSIAEAAPGTFATIRGRVTDGNAPVASASVVVPGTTIASVTDSLGRFTLRDVPTSTTTLLARRIGYVATSMELAGIPSDSTPVNLLLRPSTFMLSSVVVTTAFPSERLRNAQCLLAVEESPTRQTPLVRLLRGALRDVGTHVLTVVGWPAAGDSTEGAFAVDSAGTLTGTAFENATGSALANAREYARENTARLEFMLSADDLSWIGTVTERRGVTTRVEEMTFVPDTSSQGCVPEQ